MNFLVELEAHGNASPEVQIAWLKSVLRLKEIELNSLRLEVEAMKNYQKADDTQLEREIEYLSKIVCRIQGFERYAQPRFTTQKRKQKPWWKCLR